MTLFTTLRNRLADRAEDLQQLAVRGRDEFAERSDGLRGGIDFARARVGPVAARARTAVTGDGKPNIGADAAETAVAVADAAKRVMLEQIHTDGLELVGIREAAYRAVTEASEAGADVTAAAVGAVAGAVEGARAEAIDVEGPGRAALAGAVNAAEELGDVAVQRVRLAILRRERSLHLVD